ncbi:MAG TPA: hypothetical protein VGG33_00030 [Polyangia bacterium]
MSSFENKLSAPSQIAKLASAGTLTRVPSFYQPVDDVHRDAIYGDYVGFLGRRNGEMNFEERRYSKREAHLAKLDTSRAVFEGRFDPALFRGQYNKYDKRKETDAATQLLLIFCKVNAGEAFGVEVMREARRAYFERSEAQYQAEKIIATEEEYHTKLLLGATQYFGVQMDQAFVPPLPLKIFIHGLAKMPQRFFHSVLLAAEFSGIYMFNTLLHATRRILHDQPEVRDAMEERLCAVLVDEIGHVAYNRLALGSTGLRLARWMYPLVQKSVASQPEFQALRQFAGDAPSVAELDYKHLPEEVRKQAFFV